MGTLGLLAVLWTILLGLIGAWLRSEITAWNGPFTHWLIRQAALRLPSELQVEAEAEWIAWIDATRSPTMKIVQASHLVLKAGKARREMSSDNAPPLHRILRWGVMIQWYSVAAGLIEAFSQAPDRAIFGLSGGYYNAIAVVQSIASMVLAITLNRWLNRSAERRRKMLID